MAFLGSTYRRGFLSSTDSPVRLFRRWGCSKKRKTAGVIVIGNEILKAQISVINDNVDEIAQEIREFSEKYTHVITSGGIGPTHDDVTYEGLAKAFNDTLHRHPTVAEIIRTYFGVEDTASPAYKLAEIPKKAILKFGINKATNRPLNFPCIILENVHVFPGSPVFLQAGFGSLYKVLFQTTHHYAQEELYINATEDTFANALTQVSKEYPHVIFGSYPEGASDHKARVTIESDSEAETNRAKERFCSLIPPDVLAKKPQ